MSFDQWFAQVDQEIWLICGLGADDLADCPYRDWYNDGITPKEAARRALKNEGFPF